VALAGGGGGGGGAVQGLGVGLSSVISLLMEWIPAFFYDMIIH
jgi:hypothetical protein